MIGLCPEDLIKCDACGCDIEAGEETEVETGIMKHGRYYKTVSYTHLTLPTT